MHFKSIDKFFDEIKNVISIIIFVFIAMAILMFFYWFAYCGKVVMPDWLNNFVWNVINFFAQGYKDTPAYKDNLEILPVLTSVIFGVLTYLANCLLVFLENNHKKYKQSVIDYKKNLEKTINNELHKDFVKELKRTSFMLVKIKIVVEKHTSYLTAMTDEDMNPEGLEKEIEKYILASVKSGLLHSKGKTENSVYFLLANLDNSKEFFAELVTKSSELIKSHLRPKMNIGFYCGAELFNDLGELDEKSAYLDRVLNLKIPNKIVVTPRFRIYFDNIAKNIYDFNVLGEYNLSADVDIVQNTMLYSLQRK